VKDFEGKTAVITGAASGMGRAFADRFAKAGMNIVLADIEKEALDRAVTEMRQQEFRVLGVVTNTMSRDSVMALADKATAEFGNIHMLFNNAGVAGGRPGAAIWEAPDSDWDWVMGVNFYGVLYGLQAFVPRMIAHGEEGHIVSTASEAGLLPNFGIYGVSKHGVLSLQETLYNDLRTRGAKISASVLCPGIVHTNIDKADRNRPQELADAGAAPVERPASTMIQRGMDPANVAEIVYESVKEDRFYILPHPSWDSMVRERVEKILARGEPMHFNFLELAKRMDAGEQM
jgi:NAD(P)-dependent dehydrogenase (short-subunit alcohol dehydrogenase family)